MIEKQNFHVFDTIGNGVLVSDTHNKIIYVNQKYTEITGFKFDEVLGKNPSVSNSGKQNKKFYENMWLTLNKYSYWEGEIWNRKKSGELYPEWINISVIRDEKKIPIYYIAILSDITSKKEKEEKIIQYANYDPLTNLPNRCFFLEQLKQKINLAQRNKKKLALLFIDLDGFKSINDTHGHEIGDIYLYKIAHFLKNKLRKSDVISRFGGDEFVILLPNITSQQIVLEFIQQLLFTTQNTKIRCKKLNLAFKASIGFSIYPDDGLDVTTLLAHADAKMYEEKRKGKR